jgi:P-loop containing dynein motor region D4
LIENIIVIILYSNNIFFFFFFFFFFPISLARLAAHVCGYKVLQLTVSSGYGLNEFKDDLKAAFSIAGLKNEGVAFIFTDAQIASYVR